MATKTTKKKSKPYKMTCAPLVWKKFTKSEKILWTKFYEIFLNEARCLKGCENFMLSEYNCQLIAHNMACETVWALKVS